MSAVPVSIGQRPDDESPLRPFPPYIDLPRRVSRRGWDVIRIVSVVGYAVLVGALVIDPADGLFTLWNVIVPLLPVLFFVAPGVWRNLCPLAAANQLPRRIGRTRALKAPTWLAERGHIVAITVFLIAVCLRRPVLNSHGAITAAVLTATIAMALLGGIAFRGKSGWCSSMCPLLPVQRLYGQTPFVTSPNSHCVPCVGCTKNCYDFNPAVAYQADLTDADPDWGASRRAFAGLFPGLVLGYFLLPAPNGFTDWLFYLRLLGLAATSAGIYLALQAATRLSWSKVSALWGATAFGCFYWFASVLLAGDLTRWTGANLSWVRWVIRAVALVLALVWLARTFGIETRFKLIRAGSSGLRVDADRLHELQKNAEYSDEPVLRIEPDGREIVSQSGLTVLDAVEAAGLPLEAGCRMGMCGADPVAVRAGAANLTPMTDDERATLHRLGLADGNRLACQAVLRGNCTVALTPDRSGAAAADRSAALVLVPRSIGRVVILGGGIAGVSVAEKLREAGVDSDIALVNSEPHHLYNRMGISRVIYGRSAMSGLYLLPDNWFGDQRIDSWLNTLVSSVDVEQHTVRVATGETLEWDHLVFATGARAVVPDIAQIGLPGSFALREAGDAAQIRAHAQRVGARHAVVGGGGLLGLEGAYSLHRLGLRATVLERGERLLARGIDATASGLLRGYLEGTGIDVRATVSATALTGDGRVEAVVLSDGATLACDVFLYAVGVQPNAELASSVGITVQRGIVVDDHMRTSVPDVYACGDVAEFEGRVWGLWPTAVRQAEIVAAGLLGGDERFDLIDPPTILKGVGVALISAGRLDARSNDEVLVQEDSVAGTYARLLIADDRIVGGVLFGHSREVPHLQRLVADTVDVGAVLPDLRRGDIGALARAGQPAPSATASA